MRFAFVTDELPRAGSAGHLAMNHAIIAWLRDNGHDVRIFLLRPRLGGLAERYDAAPVIGIGVRSYRGYVIAGPRTALAMLARATAGKLGKAGTALRRRLLRRRYGAVDEVLGAYATPSQCQWAARRIAEFAADAVFADTIFRAPVLREPALARLSRLVVAHDLFHLRHRALQSAGYKVHPAELTLASEAELLNLADVILAIQPEDAAAFREFCPGRTICTVPMPALPCPRPSTTLRVPGRIVFVGSATLPNLDGLHWFFAEIWPRLAHAQPQLDLAGDCGAAFAVLPPGVTRLGRVSDLAPVLHRATLAISPLQVGSGLKVKMLDYARHGLTTVATPESLRGFAADDDAPFVPAGSAADFAAAVAARLRGDDAAGEDRALAYVIRHYTANAGFAELAAAIGAGHRPGTRESGSPILPQS